MPWRFHIFSKMRFGRKIFATMAIFIAVISFSFTLYFIRYQGQTLTANLISEGKLLAGILAYNSRIGVFSENREMIKGPLDSVLKYDSVIEVSVFNLGWELLARLKTDKYGHQPTAEAPDAESRNDISTRLARSRQPFYAEDNDRLAFWSPVSSSSVFGEEETLLGEKAQPKGENRIIGFVRVTVDKSTLNRNLRALLLRSILIAAAFLVLGSAISYLVVQKITTPLNRLTERVLALGRGGVLEQVPVETEDEVGDLASAFNTLSESLKRREMEKAQLEEHLRHAQKMEAIGTLAGGIAHDFNNILGAIMGYTELALFSAPEGSSLRRYLDELLKASNRAKDLVNQILTFSRQRDKERKPVRLAGIIDETLKMLRASLPSTIEIRQHIQEDLDPVLCDSTQIHQVVMNLCTNARHAMRAKGGVLEISLSTVEIDAKRSARQPEMKAGRYQKLSISDTGHGMARGVLARIFDPFFTTKGPGEGTGMGLAVVHGIVRDHQGLLTVRSEPGAGTEFDVFFPVSELEAGPEILRDAGPLPGNERILFVDDERALVEIAAEMLKQFGYSVTPTTRSLEALELFRAKPEAFDLIITDMTMPDMTGLDLTREILALRPDMPVILCTGFSEMISEENARALGIREFVMKPVVRNQLAEVVRRVLDKTQAPNA